MPRPKVSNEVYQAQLDKIRDIDFARLAAYIDGEGCIVISSCQKPRGRGVSKTHCMQVTVTNTYLPLFSWIVGTFGGSVSEANSNSRKSTAVKRCWRWVIGEVPSEMILRRCLPYLLIKSEQAKIALAFRDVKRRKFDAVHNGRLTQKMIRERDRLQQRISKLNSSKGFGARKSLTAYADIGTESVN